MGAYMTFWGRTMTSGGVPQKHSRDFRGSTQDIRIFRNENRYPEKSMLPKTPKISTPPKIPPEVHTHSGNYTPCIIVLLKYKKIEMHFLDMK